MDTPQSPAVLSDDGMWVWDGRTWQSAVSPDGRMRWDGWQWQPVPGQPVSERSADDRPKGRAAASWPAGSTKVAGAAAGTVALVAIGFLLLMRAQSPRMISGAGYALQVPQGWSVPLPDESCRVTAPFRVSVGTSGRVTAVDIAGRPILQNVNWKPDAIICASDQTAGQDVRVFQGTEPYYAIYVYVGISLDGVSFKPPPPWATPGYDARIPIAFPGSTRSEEVECTDIGTDTFPLWCWHIPGGQRSDSVDRDPPLCGPGKPDPAPPSGGEYFQQMGRFVSASHASRDYLIVLSGYRVPMNGFPEQYCRDFYHVLQSWKWRG